MGRMSGVDSSGEQEPIRLSSRLALRTKEVAAALGISERKLREILPELPHMRLGGVVIIPVKPLEAWLAAQSKAEMGRDAKVADDVLRAVTRS